MKADLQSHAKSESLNSRGRGKKRPDEDKSEYSAVVFASSLVIGRDRQSGRGEEEMCWREAIITQLSSSAGAVENMFLSEGTVTIVYLIVQWD